MFIDIGIQIMFQLPLPNIRSLLIKNLWRYIFLFIVFNIIIICVLFIYVLGFCLNLLNFYRCCFVWELLSHPQNYRKINVCVCFVISLEMVFLMAHLGIQTNFNIIHFQYILFQFYYAFNIF